MVPACRAWSSRPGSLLRHPRLPARGNHPPHQNRETEHGVIRCGVAPGLPGAGGQPAKSGESPALSRNGQAPYGDESGRLADGLRTPVLAGGAVSVARTGLTARERGRLAAMLAFILA